MNTAKVTPLALLFLILAPTVALAGDNVAEGIADQRVDFAAIEPIPGASAVPPGRVAGYLDKPEGTGPFPALALLHGCAGLYEMHRDWARMFVDWGYVTLRVDSFGPRGITEICTNIRRPVPRAADTLGALAYLEKLPYVDRDRLAMIGWSHGAGVVLDLARDYAFPAAYRGRLRAAVAFYPYCSSMGGALVPPALVLIGGADDWTPAERCRAMAKRVTAGGRPMALEVYAGATHSFDCRRCNGVYWGHRLVYGPKASAAAAKRLKAFLAASLAP